MTKSAADAEVARPPPWTLTVPVATITLPGLPVVEAEWPPAEPVVEVRWPPPGWRRDRHGVWRPEPDEAPPAEPG